MTGVPASGAPIAVLEGRALVFGDDVNTDHLHPSMFFSLDPGQVRRGFLGAVRGREGIAEEDAVPRILVAGRHFGGGSSRETTVRALHLSGVVAVVAVGFGRIFRRNALGTGLAAVTCAEATTLAREGELLRVDLERGLVSNAVTGRSAPLEPLDPLWHAVLRAGGLEAWLRARGDLP